jgi:ribosomal protein S8
MVVFLTNALQNIQAIEKYRHKLHKAGRCRWKNENELFNVMKNQGYCMEHNYGHGQKNVAFNFYLLTLLAFLMHQIFELTDRNYQACRAKLGSKKHLYETLRFYIKIIVFDTWDRLLEFVLMPTSYHLLPLGSSP